MEVDAFQGISPDIEKVARTLKANGLAHSVADAVSLAKSISSESPRKSYGAEKIPTRFRGLRESGPPDHSTYGAEKIPNPYLEKQRQGGGVENLTPEEVGPPLSHMNPREKREAAKIENIEPAAPKAKHPLEHDPFLQAAKHAEKSQEPEVLEARPKLPQPEPLHRPQPEVARAEEVQIQELPPVEHVPADFAEDHRSVRELLEEDAAHIYGTHDAASVPQQEEEPSEEPMPEIRAVEEEPAPAPVQERAPEPVPQAPVAPIEQKEHAQEIPADEKAPEKRGRGLTEEERELTDITKIFYFGQ